MSPEPRAPGTLLLVPVPIDPEADMASALTAPGLARIRALRHFVAENARTARRFLAAALDCPIQQVSFTELSEHTPEAGLDDLLAPLLAGHDCGLVSEAGCPGIADPGAALVSRAHARGLRVEPLAGASAIVLAIMASGLAGQAFRFVGYLPQDAGARAERLRALEADSVRRRESVWCIETPYRNRALWTALLETLGPGTRLAVSVGLCGPDALSLTATVAEWRGLPAPDLERRPAVFGLQAAGVSEPVRRPARRRT